MLQSKLNMDVKYLPRPRTLLIRLCCINESKCLGVEEAKKRVKPGQIFEPMHMPTPIKSLVASLPSSPLRELPSTPKRKAKVNLDAWSTLTPSTSTTGSTTRQLQRNVIVIDDDTNESTPRSVSQLNVGLKGLELVSLIDFNETDSLCH